MIANRVPPSPFESRIAGALSPADAEQVVRIGQTIYDMVSDDFAPVLDGIGVRVKSLEGSLNGHLDDRVGAGEQFKSLEFRVAGLSEQLKDLEAQLAVRLGKTFERDFKDLLGRSLEEREKGFEDRLNAQGAQHSAELVALRKSYDGLVESLQESHRGELAYVKAVYENGQNEVRELLKALAERPAAQVNVTVPENAIKHITEVNQLPSVVNVTNQVPEALAPVIHNEFITPPEAFQLSVNQPAAIVNVRVPKQERPVVNVQAGNVEVKSILSMPKRKTTEKKRLVYNEQIGRPEEVITERTEESEE